MSSESVSAASLPDEAQSVVGGAAPYQSYDRFWHIASFRCPAEFGRYPGVADIEQACIKRVYKCDACLSSHLSTPLPAAAPVANEA